MQLLDLIHRQPHPRPWEEGDNIPWNEPGFSERMLHEHLSQQHDHASRRFDIIDRHVAWIHQEVLKGRPSRFLDLGCGPGLYASRLAQLGHTCVGIDWSPASIRFARQQAQQLGLACTYQESDVRQASFGEGFDLVQFVYGEFNVFKPADADLILGKAYRALNPGGKLLLEVHTFDYMQRMGLEPASWYSSASGLFSPQPYLVLEEAFWEPEEQAVTRRYYILDAASAQVTRYAASYQAYSDDSYRSLLERSGFQQVTFFPSLSGETPAERSDFIVITAERG